MSKRYKKHILIFFCLLSVSCINNLKNDIGEKNNIENKSSVVLGARVASEIVTLKAKNNRGIDVKLFYPASGCQYCTLIFFSHGANLSYKDYDVLIHKWVDNGFVVIAPLHVDSELHPNRTLYGREVHLPFRMEDIKHSLSYFLSEKFNITNNISLNGNYIAVGHSFGALIAQIAGGATMPGLQVALERDPISVVAISPPGTVAGFISPETWSSLSKPMLVITGTKDVLPIIAPQWQNHLVSYENSPNETSLAVIFDNEDHYFNGAFGRINYKATENNNIVTLNNIITQFFVQSINNVAVSDMSFSDQNATGIKFLQPLKNELKEKY